MPIKKRLLKRLVAEGAASCAASALSSSTDSVWGIHWDGSVDAAALSEAEKCHPSLVEELIHPKQVRSGFPSNWSLHRIITAISMSQSEEMKEWWKYLVEYYDHFWYYEEELNTNQPKERRCPNCTSKITLNKFFAKLRKEMTQAALCDALLLAIFKHLPDVPDRFGLSLVSRRWNYLVRLAWKPVSRLKLDAKLNAKETECCLRASKIFQRMFVLTKLVISDGVHIAVGDLAKLEGGAVAFPCLSKLHVVDATFVSSQVSLADANEKVLQFLRKVVMLRELVLINVKVSFIIKGRGRLNIDAKRSLDFRFPAANKKKKSADDPCVVPLQNVHLSGSVLQQRFNPAAFKVLCQRFQSLETERLILSGAFIPAQSCPAPSPLLTQSLANLMPQLRELSFVNVSFADGSTLKSRMVAPLAKKISRISKLQLFCLINGEISEDALYDLQCCEHLQVIVLLRCKIRSSDTQLRLAAAWHPKSDQPSTILTDHVTLPRWFKPTYFRVVRIPDLSQLAERKFDAMRQRWWTIGELLASCQRKVSAFVLEELPAQPDPVDFLADASFFHR